ncbi:MAG: hypothetical protein ABSH48_22415, partial [Verrucomicrobiota bacterium]
MDKSKSNQPENGQPAAKSAAAAPPAAGTRSAATPPVSEKAARAGAPAAPPKVAPMFRPIDWLTLAVTFGVIWIIYLCTLAPEQ